MYQFEFKPETCWYKDVCYKDCNQTCLRYMEMHYLTETSGVPKYRQYPQALIPENKDYDSFVRLSDIKLNIVNFVKSGKNLYICSEFPGNGKTTWSVKIIMKYFNEIWAGNGFRSRALFIHVPTFLTQLKNFNNVDIELDNIKEILPTIDLVVWDDIASVGISNYDHTQLLTYIDQRILANKSNIFTSNLITQNDLQKSLGVRLASRIWGTSEIITFYGGDRRDEK